MMPPLHHCGEIFQNPNEFFVLSPISTDVPTQLVRVKEVCKVSTVEVGHLLSPAPQYTTVAVSPSAASVSL